MVYGKNPQRYERKPNIELTQRLSNDGRFWIFKRVETWVVPVKYLDLIRQSHNHKKNEPTASGSDDQAQGKGERNDNGDR